MIRKTNPVSGLEAGFYIFRWMMAHFGCDHGGYAIFKPNGRLSALSRFKNRV